MLGVLVAAEPAIAQAVIGRALYFIISHLPVGMVPDMRPVIAAAADRVLGDRGNTLVNKAIHKLYPEEA